MLVPIGITGKIAENGDLCQRKPVTAQLKPRAAMSSACTNERRKEAQTLSKKPNETGGALAGAPRLLPVMH